MAHNFIKFPPYFNTQREKTMNSLKAALVQVLRSPFIVIRVPALSPGVMAVEAAPDFHHTDARAGCPSAVRAAPVKPSRRAPRHPVAARHRATSLKVILLSAALAVAGIGARMLRSAKLLVIVSHLHGSIFLRSQTQSQ